MRRYAVTAALIAGVLLVAVLLRAYGSWGFVERGIRAVTDATLQWSYQSSVSIKSGEEAIKNSNTNACTVESARLTQLELENAELRTQLNFLKNTARHVGATVIGRSLDPIGTTIVIDRGAADGIVVNRPVIVNNGYFIGKIARVDEHTSVVRLMSDFQSKTAATVDNRDKSLGVVEGGFGLTVRLNLIPQNEVIRPGDVVITSGLEPDLPRGLAIGTVEVVEKKPQEPFQQAIIKPSADLHALTVVSVILP